MTELDLHVGLLNEADPELITATGVGAQKLSMVTHWQTVINHHLGREVEGEREGKRREERREGGKEERREGGGRDRRKEGWRKFNTYANCTVSSVHRGFASQCPTFRLHPLRFKQTRYFPLGLMIGSPFLFCGKIHLERKG